MKNISVMLSIILLLVGCGVSQEEVDKAFSLCENNQYKEAFPLMQDAAEDGYAQAQGQLGFMYLNGLGVEKDLKKAEYWTQKAADQGISQAQNNLKLFGVLPEQDAIAIYYRGDALLCNDGHTLVDRASHPEAKRFMNTFMVRPTLGVESTTLDNCKALFNIGEIQNSTFYPAYDYGYDQGVGKDLNDNMEYMQIAISCRMFNNIYYIDACMAGYALATQNTAKLSKERFNQGYDFIKVRQTASENPSY
jgi:hypothetical protein